MATIKNLKTDVDNLGNKAERTRILVEGVDGDNGIKSELATHKKILITILVILILTSADKVETFLKILGLFK